MHSGHASGQRADLGGQDGTEDNRRTTERCVLEETGGDGFRGQVHRQTPQTGQERLNRTSAGMRHLKPAPAAQRSDVKDDLNGTGEWDIFAT